VPRNSEGCAAPVGEFLAHDPKLPDAPNVTRALITSGSRGLSRSTVLNLAKHGVKTIFTYNAAQQEAQAVAPMAVETGAKATPLKHNTGDGPSLTAFAQR
jgi:NAD(P)-dependent dehydrogenase (short-subunit alcohol dehydrogenase family)